jgi:flagellar protein FliO/FliZ
VDFSIYFRFLVALVFVLALIGLLAWAARRFGVLRGTVRAKGGTRRIEVVEIVPIDSKRRLALIRRDQTEHLILLGSTGDLIVETGIDPVRAAAPGSGQSSE